VPISSDEAPTAASEPLTEAADYPLYVVTAGASGVVSGCLAGFVTQSSLRPVRFIVCISKVNHTFGIAEQASGLALHLLGANQQEMASLFGERTGDCTDKFDRVRWSPGSSGAPRLHDCAAWVEGPVLDRMSAGDHEAFLLAVSDGGSGPREGQFLLSDAADFDPGHP
jgi:flavin reductase (DIM6/NTAB) family NADH-FMN oxidoreductase RutF